MNSEPILVPEDRPFRILQLTDFHSDAGEEARAATHAMVEDFVRRYSPDFLAVTGDIWCADEQPDRASDLQREEIAFIDSFELPWAFAWGNHDAGVDRLPESLALFDDTRHCCKRWGDDRGSLRVELEARSTGRVVWELYFLNSGLSWEPERDLKWFLETTTNANESSQESIPRIVFFHIPLRNYAEAMAEGRAGGTAREEVLCWGDEEGRVEEIIKLAGRVRACFCGHSHRNDFHFREDGILFSYGRCTGHGGYGEDLPRGAKLISLDARDGSLGVRTVVPEA
jgi:3',5'-cyclic AMP phosphodiesterase CpdA